MAWPYFSPKLYSPRTNWSHELTHPWQTLYILTFTLRISHEHYVQNGEGTIGQYPNLISHIGWGGHGLSKICRTHRYCLSFPHDIYEIVTVENIVRFPQPAKPMSPPRSCRAILLKPMRQIQKFENYAQVKALATDFTMILHGREIGAEAAPAELVS